MMHRCKGGGLVVITIPATNQHRLGDSALITPVDKTSENDN